MRRVPFVAMLAFLASAFAGAQVVPPAPQGARPGVPGPGAQAPGLPPRDSATRAPQTGTGKVRGRVLASPSGEPLRRAQIALTAADPGPAALRRVTTTNAEGRFEFTDLPAGRFSVSATKAGFVTLQFGQRRPFEAGTPLNVSDGQTVERVDFALPRGSVIVARITDEFGEPVTGVAVQVQRYQYGQDGQRRLTGVGGTQPFAATDDRGEFRAFGLMPGEYVVQASMRTLGTATGGGNEANEGFATTFYPGTLSADEAQPVTVAVGEERPVQFSMIASRMGRVSGQVVDGDGRPASGASLTLVTVTGNGMSSSSVGTVAPDGSFTISGIAPGEHTLRASYVRPGTASEFASTPISVGGTDIAGLRMALGPGTTISGRVTFEGTSPRGGSGAPMRVNTQQADQQQQFALLGVAPNDPLANGTLDVDGNFTLAGATGRVFLTVGPQLQPWVIKSVTLAGDDITDVPVELTGRTALSDVHIVLTDKQAGVSGQVTNDRGQPLTDYVVVIQGAEQREPVIASRAIRVVRPDTEGRFQTRGIRPGRYVATAIEALEQGRQFAPEFQQQLRRSAREFTVREGETVTVDLRLTPDL